MWRPRRRILRGDTILIVACFDCFGSGCSVYGRFALKIMRGERRDAGDEACEATHDASYLPVGIPSFEAKAK